MTPPTNRECRIGLAGWYGYRNVGDDLLLRLLAERLDPAAVFATRAGTWAGGPVLDAESLPEWRERLDLLVIGGGGLLNERWLRKLPLEVFGGAYGLLSVGIPHLRWLDDLEPLLSGARFVTVRDHLALEQLRRAYPGVDAWWLPDPAFMLPRRSRPRADRLLLNPRSIPRTWLREDDPEDAEERVVSGFSELAAATAKGTEVLALGFEASDRPLLERLPCEHRIVDAVEAVELIAGSRALVTSRLHGGVIAATQGTPVVLVDYQDKIRGLARLLGLPAVALDGLGGLSDAVAAVLDAPASPSPAAYGELVGRMLGFLRRC